MKLMKQAEVRHVRKHLLVEQCGLDALTGEPLDPSKAVLDHCHESQFIRGVISRG